jgi:hypothetical protein
VNLLPLVASTSDTRQVKDRTLATSKEADHSPNHGRARTPLEQGLVLPRFYGLIRVAVDLFVHVRHRSHNRLSKPDCEAPYFSWFAAVRPGNCQRNCQIHVLAPITMPIHPSA